MAVAGASIALSIGFGLIPGNPSLAVVAPPTEAEEMQRIVQERTGKMPQVEAAPPVADDSFSKPQRKLASDQLSDFARELQ